MAVKYPVTAVLLACCLTGCAVKKAETTPEAVPEAAVKMTDEVILKDGSRFVGRVIRIEGGRLKMLSRYAGELDLPKSEVKSITTKTKLNVKTKAGDTIVGVLEHDASAGQKIVGDHSVEIAGLDSAWLPGQDSPETAAAKAQTEKERAK